MKLTRAPSEILQKFRGLSPGNALHSTGKARGFWAESRRFTFPPLYNSKASPVLLAGIPGLPVGKAGVLKAGGIKNS